jgi:protein-disulfide isomerase
MINRIIFLIAIIGMSLAIHLWIQQERGFDRGCWGVGPQHAPALTGCNDPALERASSLFGVSNAVWGYAFYLLVGALTLGKIFLGAAGSTRCRSLAEIVVAGAAPYTGYLVFYQIHTAKAVCPLCMVSAGLVVTLTALHFLQWRNGDSGAVDEPRRGTEAGYLGGILFVTLGLFAALFVFVDGAGGGAAGGGRARSPARIVPPLKVEEWVAADTPRLGAPAGVTVIGFFDPNCPHCDKGYDMLVKISERLKDRATVHVFVRVLWDYSLLQAQALELAKQEGKYFEMWQRQFARRKQGGLGLKEIEELFLDLELDTQDLEKRLAAMRPGILAQRDKAKAAGINSTPQVFINGQPVTGGDRAEERLVKLIDDAAAQRPTTK